MIITGNKTIDPVKFLRKVVCCFCVIGVVAIQPALGQDRLVLNTAAQPPFHNPDETGFVDTVLKEVFGRIGIKLSIVKVPAERALINANAGIDDGDAFRISGLQSVYPNLIQVPEVIGYMSFTVFSKGITLSSSNWQELSPYSIGIITGWKILEAKVPTTAKLTKVKNVMQLFTLLIKDRTDLVLYNTYGGLAYLRQNKITGIQAMSPPLAKNDMYFYLHKKHASLVPELVATIREIKTDGTYQRFIDQILTPISGN